jgi:hypothetical protein
MRNAGRYGDRRLAHERLLRSGILQDPVDAILRLFSNLAKGDAGSTPVLIDAEQPPDLIQSVPVLR